MKEKDIYRGNIYPFMGRQARMIPIRLPIHGFETPSVFSLCLPTPTGPRPPLFIYREALYTAMR